MAHRIPEEPTRDRRAAQQKRRRRVRRVRACCLAFLLFAGVLFGLYFWAEQMLTAPQGAASQDAVYDAGGAWQPDEKKYGATLLKESACAAPEYLANTLFAGDSNTVRLHAYGLVSLEGHMGKEGMSTQGALSTGCVYFQGDGRAYTLAQAAALVKPRRIVLTLGTNDIAGGRTAQQIAADYKKVVQALRQADPACDILINAVPPVARQRAYPSVTMQEIDACNEALLALAREMHLPFLNSCEVLKGPDGFGAPEYFIPDGLHLSEKGARALLEYVRLHPYDTQDRHTGPAQAPARRRAPAAAASGAEAPPEASAVPQLPVAPQPEPEPPVSSAPPESGASSESLSPSASERPLPDAEPAAPEEIPASQPSAPSDSVSSAAPPQADSAQQSTPPEEAPSASSEMPPASLPAGEASSCAVQTSIAPSAAGETVPGEASG